MPYVLLSLLFSTMPDEQTRWERVASRPNEVSQFRAQQSTNSFRAVPKANPHRSEAEQDRLIFRWFWMALGLVAVIAVLAWQVFFN